MRRVDVAAYESPTASHLMINEQCERHFREEMATMSFVEFEEVVCESRGGKKRPRLFNGLCRDTASRGRCYASRLGA